MGTAKLVEQGASYSEGYIRYPHGFFTGHIRYPHGFKVRYNRGILFRLAKKCSKTCIYAIFVVTLQPLKSVTV